MPSSVTVEAKIVGQRRSAPSWTVPIPDLHAGEALRLRDVITQIVLAEVSAFRERQDQRRLLQVLTPEAIARGVDRGKVDLGGRDLQQSIDPQAAVDTALLAFQDGFYLVFVDGQQQESLDVEVHLSPDSRLSFVRLTPLAGG